MNEQEAEALNRKFRASLSGAFTIRKMTDERLPEADGSLHWFVPAGGPLAKDGEQLKLLNEITSEFIGGVAGETVRVILLLQSNDGHNYAYFKYEQRHEPHLHQLRK